MFSAAKSLRETFLTGTGRLCLCCLHIGMGLLRSNFSLMLCPFLILFLSSKSAPTVYAVEETVLIEKLQAKTNADITNILRLSIGLHSSWTIISRAERLWLRNTRLALGTYRKICQSALVVVRTEAFHRCCSAGQETWADKTSCISQHPRTMSQVLVEVLLVSRPGQISVQREKARAQNRYKKP